MTRDLDEIIGLAAFEILEQDRAVLDGMHPRRSAGGHQHMLILFQMRSIQHYPSVFEVHG